MDGILIINKKLGLSSHDCVRAIRKIYKTKKVGHSGTLDIEASGVLVLGINKGTKLLQYLNQEDKTYVFDVCFGVETDTLDHLGEIVSKKPVQTLEKFDIILQEFVGAYNQVPPAYSAVKIDGKKLYEYARKNLPIPEVKARPLKIYSLERLSDIVSNDGLAKVTLKVHASKGFYVRQFALDLARQFDTVAHTLSIHRTQAGDYTLDQAYDIEAITDNPPKPISLSEALPSMPEYVAEQSVIDQVQYGKKIVFDLQEPMVKIINKQNVLLAIYEKKEGYYKPKNVFM